MALRKLPSRRIADIADIICGASVLVGAIAVAALFFVSASPSLADAIGLELLAVASVCGVTAATSLAFMR